MEKLTTITAEPFGVLRLMAEGTWVQTFVHDWTTRWCNPRRSVLQQWYLRIIAMSGQLVIYCRILRYMQDDPDARDILKRDIASLAVMLLEDAHTHSTHLHTLNHSVACHLQPFLPLGSLPNPKT
jgi:hypothetical protein